MLAELVACLDLPTGDFRLLWGEQARLGAAPNGPSQAEARTVPGHGIGGARAAGFGALDEAFGDC